MATRAATTRLGKESKMMDKDPPPFCYARPKEDNILEWHFILRGPPQTPFHGGEYWGQLLFPPEYPFKPPGIKVSTPSGRFHVNTKICTSMSDFHPGTWSTSWSVGTILVGLLSFMCSDEITTGSVMTSHSDRVTLAQQSHSFNIKQPRFKKMFPEYSAEAIRDLPNMGDKPGEASSGSSKEVQPAQASGTGHEQLRRASAASSNLSSTAVANVNATTTANVSSTTAASASFNAAPPAKVQLAAAPARSRAIASVLVALAAYVFISRFTSWLSGGSLSA